MTTITAQPTRAIRPHRLLAYAWLTVFVPFVVTVINGGPAGGVIDHGAYHLAYVGVIALAVTVLWKWRRATSDRGVRRTLTAALVLHALAAVGHVGEAISTTMSGSYEEDGTASSSDQCTVAVAAA